MGFILTIPTPPPPSSSSPSAQVKVFVTGLFSLNQDIPAFKEHLRDFLVQIKVTSRESKHKCLDPTSRQCRTP